MKKLPKFLKQYFWEVDFKKLYPAKNPYYIIQRILNYGDKRAVKWLFKNFDVESMKYMLRNYRGFTKRAVIRWGQFFRMPKRDMMYFKTGFPNPPTRMWPY